MKKAHEIIKEREEELKKISTYTNEYGYVHQIPNYEKIKSFHATTISLVLNSLKEDINLMMDIGALAAGTPQAMEHNVGWENCKHHISTLLSQTISNIQTK